MKKSALKSLSDKELLSQLERIRRQEHLSTIDILLHLNEVERRKLHLKLGHGSLYDYCVTHLKYSGSAACRRIKSARCNKRFPEALKLLEKNRVNLMTLSIIAPVLTEENHHTLLGSICGKTQREAEAIASQYRPPITMRDRVSPVRVRVSEPRAVARAQAQSARPRPGEAAQVEGRRTHTGDDNRTSMSDYHQTGGDIMLTNAKNGNGQSSGERTVVTKQKLLIQFLANKEFMEKYEEVRALLSQRLSDTSFENIFEALIQEFLERHCPIRKKARRDKKKTASRKPCSAAAQKQPTPAETSRQVKPEPRSRHIPAAVRDKVFARDKGRCTYVGKTRKCCGSTQALQIDHVRPFIRGVDNSISNLRLLCAKHNRLVAQELFGEEFMERWQPRE